MENEFIKKNNFLITGFGRSGTKFLSAILNMSATYTVSHETTGKSKDRTLKTFDDHLFSKKYVGEVNSYHCLIGEEIYERNITNVFYTLRLPTDICFSLSRRYIDDKHLINYIEYTNQLVEHIEEFFSHVRDSLIDPSRLFFFEKFTQEEKYLHSLCQAVGVTDISLSSISKKINIKVNASSVVVDSLDEVFSPANLKKIKEIDQIYYELFDRCFKTS